MHANTLLILASIASVSLVVPSVSALTPLDLRKRHHWDGLFDEPAFWDEFDEWRRGRGRGRGRDGRDGQRRDRDWDWDWTDADGNSRRGRRKDHGSGRGSGNRRDGLSPPPHRPIPFPPLVPVEPIPPPFGDDSNDNGNGNLEPPFIILPDPSLIWPPPIEATITSIAGGTYWPTASASTSSVYASASASDSASATDYSTMTTTTTQRKPTTSAIKPGNYSVVLKTVPESTVYATVTGRFRPLNNSAAAAGQGGVLSSRGGITFLVLLLASAVMAALI